MLKIVSFKICPFVQRVTAILEAKQIPYQVEYITLKDKPQWFLDISPHGQVPIMQTKDGTVLFESDAIVEYIEDEYGPLEQALSNEQRALDRAWSYLATKHYLTQCSAMSSADDDTFHRRETKLRLVFERVEKQLSGHSRYFRSNRLSRVDIAWLPMLHRAAIVKAQTGFDFLSGLPKMQSWQRNLLNTGLAERSVSSDFVVKFTDFYLTDTYLATGQDKPQSTCSSGSCCN